MKLTEIVQEEFEQHLNLKCPLDSFEAGTFKCAPNEEAPVAASNHPMKTDTKKYYEKAYKPKDVVPVTAGDVASFNDDELTSHIKSHYEKVKHLVEVAKYDRDPRVKQLMDAFKKNQDVLTSEYEKRHKNDSNSSRYSEGAHVDDSMKSKGHKRVQVIW